MRWRTVGQGVALRVYDFPLSNLLDISARSKNTRIFRQHNGQQRWQHRKLRDLFALRGPGRIAPAQCGKVA